MIGPLVKRLHIGFVTHGCGVGKSLTTLAILEALSTRIRGLRAIIVCTKAMIATYVGQRERQVGGAPHPGPVPGVGDQRHGCDHPGAVVQARRRGRRRPCLKEYYSRSQTIQALKWKLEPLLNKASVDDLSTKIPRARERVFWFLGSVCVLLERRNGKNKSATRHHRPAACAPSTAADGMETPRPCEHSCRRAK